MILLLLEAIKMQTGLDLGRHHPKPPSKGSNSGSHVYSVVLVKYRCAGSYPDPMHCTMISPFKRTNWNSGQGCLRGKEEERNYLSNLRRQWERSFQRSEDQLKQLINSNTFSNFLTTSTFGEHGLNPLFW